MATIKIRSRFAQSIAKVKSTNPALAEALQKVYDLSKQPGDGVILLHAEKDLQKVFPPKKEEEETPEEETPKEETPEEESTEEEPQEEEMVEGEEPSDAEGEPADAAEGTRKIIIDLLEELGLVEKTEGMVKTVTPTLIKSVSSDIAQIALAVEVLAEELSKVSSGPVLRELGSVNSFDIQARQQMEQLRKTLESTKDPSVRQALQNQISQIEIRLIQNKENQ